MTAQPLGEDPWDSLQREAFEYFLYEDNPALGLIRDKSQEGAPASIAAVGLALSSYPVGVERGFVERAIARQLTLSTLRFFWNSPQGTALDATGYKGFYYHFLDMTSGRRVGQCELSTVDTALFLAGALTAQAYFNEDSEEEQEIRTLADSLYRRTDWNWARNGGPAVTHGWTPESGFLPFRWEGFDEALLLYVLGLGSPSYPLPAESYGAWMAPYLWKKVYDYEFLYAGPLFIHQLSHVWIDFRGIQDVFMLDKGIDYFENSRRATLVQQRYAIENPFQFEGYGKNCWGITASDGPGWLTHHRVKGIDRSFYGYHTRGAPFGPDDGTISPWATVTSLPFAPEIVLPALHWFNELKLRIDRPYGFKASFNPTCPDADGSPHGWVSPFHFGVNEGPIVLMIENYRSGLIWRLMRQCLYLVAGLRRAGFKNGWL
jgi:hypothetical protein